MERSIKEMVKDALEELIADNTIIIEDDNGHRIQDLVLNVVQSEELEEEDFDNEEEDDNE